MAWQLSQASKAKNAAAVRSGQIRALGSTSARFRAGSVQAAVKSSPTNNSFLKNRAMLENPAKERLSAGCLREEWTRVK